MSGRDSEFGSRGPRRGPGRPEGGWQERRGRAPSPLVDAGLEGRRLILGQQAVREAIRAQGQALHEVLIEERPSPRAEAIERFARDQGLTIRHVPRAELERLGGGTLHQGVAAYAEPLKLTPVADLWTQPDLLALALDGVVDPQNFGAAVRSATGLCRAPILWPENASAPLTPATFRASAGAIEHATLCRVPSLTSALNDAIDAGIQVVGLAPEADRYLHQLDLLRPTIVVIGSEQKGMTRGVRKVCTDLVKLGGSGAVQSLNASVAAGIALHTAVVQRLSQGR
ncbi:MAG TPA: RNA methyltransferase [Polyangiaceae bacterium]|nr:RNA methyltransferase [Polyangiaceae bacterium]